MYLTLPHSHFQLIVKGKEQLTVTLTFVILETKDNSIAKTRKN